MTSSTPKPGDIITIEKLAPDGKPVTVYYGWLIADEDPVLALARWERSDLPLPYTTFAHGDLLLEAYYQERPYNVFALFDGRLAPREIDWGEVIARNASVRPTLQSLHAICGRMNARCPLKGYYINFTRPAQYDPVRRRLIWQDLALDIWIPAEGNPLVLDEDAYLALGLDRAEPELAQAIERIKNQILQRRLPF